MKKIFIFWLCFLLLLLSGCGTKPSALPEPPESAISEEPIPVLSPEEIAELERQAERERLAQEVEDLLQRLTLEEKVSQLFFFRCPQADTAAFIETYRPGGILLFTRDYKDPADNWLSEDAFTDKITAMQTASENAVGISLLIGSDEEGGTVTRASRNPNLFAQKFPSPQTLIKRGGMEHLLTETAAYNAQLAYYGINVNFAPVCDISANPADFIYERSFGQDAESTALYLSQVIPTMADAGVASVLKHFPGYGNNVDTHTGIAVDTRPYDQFMAEDFLPFLAGIEAGAPFVLVSHNIVTCLDDTLPASLSPAWHRELRHMGFDGVILTDDLDMGAVQSYVQSGSIAVTALLAGNDMIVCSDTTQIQAVLNAVKDGILSEELINNACRRVLTEKQQLHLL